MKRILSLALAVLMLAVTLAACAPAENSASSSADVRTEALARLPEGTVVAVGSETAEYGVDMSDFDEDGYIVRSVGGTLTVLAKSDAGLDLASRYAAKNAGKTGIDTVYGEGHKIERLTISGTDISEYVIVYPTSTPYGTFEENLLYTAETLQKFIFRACGVEVPLVPDSREGCDHVIELVVNPDGDTADDGFIIETDEKGMTITGRKRGPMYGAFTFLENYLGYRFLSKDVTYLYEADSIDVPAGIYDKQVPQFLHRAIYSEGGNFDAKNEDYIVELGAHAFSTKYGGGSINETCHGYHIYIPSVPGNVQPCLTDPDLLEECIANISEELHAIEKTYPGFEDEITRSVRLGHNDNNGFCQCSRCMKEFSREGDFSGLNVKFCNAVADALNEEFDRDIYVGMFAYWGAIRPPKYARPNDHVVVTYCAYQMCWNHVLGGEECNPNRLGYDELSNKRHLDYLTTWCEITDKVIVYWYGTSHQSVFAPMSYLQMFENIRKIGEAGADGIMSYSMMDNPMLGEMMEYMFCKQIWNPTMSEEELKKIYDEAVWLYCGDGWEYIEELSEIYTDAKRIVDCFEYNYREYTNYFDIGVRYDEVMSLCDKALSLVNSEWQQKNVEKYCSMIYTAVLAGAYETRYVNGTDAERADFVARYETLVRWWNGMGYKFTFDPDVHPLDLIEPYVNI